MMGAALELAVAREDRDAIRRQTAELTDYLARVTVVYRTLEKSSATISTLRSVEPLHGHHGLR